mmetsp:Transcript_82642/g.215687  ORF Transcript_82642/g.215687 Transcript_82642/m.215687 type:complete len:201 (+) Transcript_82642:920-1522(+)
MRVLAGGLHEGALCWAHHHAHHVRHQRRGAGGGVQHREAEGRSTAASLLRVGSRLGDRMLGYLHLVRDVRPWEEWIALEVYHRAAGHRLALRYHWGLRGYVLWPHGDEHDGGGRNALLGVHSVHPGSRAGASRCHITPRARRLVDTWPLESPRRVRTLRVRAHRNARLGHEDHRGDRTLAHQGWSRELAEASPRQVGQAG